MANETTATSANDIRYTALINAAILEEARPFNVSKQFFYMGGAGNGVGMSFPVQDDPGAASSLTEGTDASNTQLTTSEATATATEQGIMATITDRLASVSIIDAMDHFASVLGRSVAERVENICAAQWASFSNTTGTSGSDLTLTQFITAVNALVGREAPGNYVAVLHPQQVLDLQVGSGNTPGGFLSAVSNGSNFLANPQLRQSIMDNAAPAGYVGEVMGVPIYQTTAVTTANTGADRAGAVFADQKAEAAYQLWDIRTELQRDASLRATEVVVTTCFGVVEWNDAFGQSIITDA